MGAYSDSDVIRVARFVLSKSGHEHWQDNTEYPAMYCCSFCGATMRAGFEKENNRYVQPNPKDFRHKADCLCLVAQDLLTNAPTEAENL